MDENKDKSSEDIKLHDLLIKQHAVLLKQYEIMANMQEKNDEKSDEIDLSKLIPKFLRKNSETENNPAGKKLIDEATLSKGAKIATENISEGAKAMFSGSKKGIAYLFDYLLNIYLSSIKRFKVFIGFVFIIALAYGVFIYITADPVYRASLVLDSSGINKNFFEGLVIDLGNLAQTESYNSLAKKIDLTEYQASNILNLAYENDEFFIIIKEETDSTDAVLIYPFFTVVADLKDNSVLPVLSEKLVAYLSENPFIHENKKVKKAVLEATLTKYKAQISSLDSMKKAIVDRISKKNENDSYWVKESNAAGGGLILSQEQPMEIQPMIPFTTTMAIENKELKAQEQLLRLENNFKVINNFSAINKPIFPRIRHIIFYSLKGLILGSIISFFLALIFPKKTKKSI